MKSIGVVLAAGLGTRLRPSTLNCPKPLIPVAGVEPLFFALYKFYQMGVHTVFVNTHHLDYRIREKLAQWKLMFPNFEIIVSFEKEILGTGGALLKIFSEHSEKFKNAQMILQNGDTLAGIDIEAFLTQPHANQFAISFLSEHLQKYKPLWVDSRGMWTGIGKTPPNTDSVPAHFLGIHSLGPQAINALLAMLKAGTLKVEESDLFNGIYRPLVTEGFEFSAIEYFKSSLPNFDFWFDMTSKEFLLEAQKFILTHLNGLPLWMELIAARYPGILQTTPGCWSLSTTPNFIRIEAPSLLLLKNGSSLHSSGGKLVLGPHSSFIYEGDNLSLDIRPQEVKIENGVFFVQDSGTKTNTSPVVMTQNIDGDLFIQ